MTTPIGKALDAAYPGWTVAELKAAGIVAVGRYVAYKPNSKVIEKPEHDALVVGGIGVFLVWETTTNAWSGGYPAGYAAGHEARAQARALGRPDERPIFAAYDEGVGPSPSLLDYQRGFNDGGGVGAQGAYGDAAIGATLLNVGLARMFWQTNATGWPGNAVDDPRSVMTQRYALTVPGVSGSYDVDDIFAADFGQWPAPVPAKPLPLPPIVTAPIPGDDKVQRTEIPMNLDAHGNGHVPVPGVKAADVVAVLPITSDPATTHAYAGVPRLALTIGVDGFAEVVVVGGTPSGRVTVRVVHA